MLSQGASAGHGGANGSWRVYPAGTMTRHLHQGHSPASVSKPTPTHAPIEPDDPGCLELLAKRLREQPGVVALEADFRESTLRVRYEPTKLTPEELDSLAAEVGSVFAQRVTTCERRDTLEGCSECALRLGHLSPSSEPDFDASASPGRVSLSRRAQPHDVAEVVRPLATKSWGARNTPDEQEHASEGRAMIILTGVCLTALFTGMGLERTGLPAWYHHAAYIVSAVTGGWFAAKGTIQSLSKFRFDVNLLMILAAIGAGSIDHFKYLPEAAILMFLFSLSNTLEVYTMGRTRHALHALLKLRPARALVRREGREVEVEAESVRVGEVCIVKPGEALPVDGTVALGASLIDQSSLTGESVPVEKQVGDKVFAGTLNQQGALEITATRAAGDTALARIVQLVQQAQEQKSKTEEMADWVGRYYTIVVIIGSALMLFVPPFILGEDWNASFYRAMTLLVVASPCALVIATPATILSAIANAARNGILFKGGAYIEALGRVKVVAFDKTGTLTHGRFEVTDVAPLDGVTETELLGWAAAAEMRSQHPLAQAVVRAAEKLGVTIEPAESLTNQLGKGLVAVHRGIAIEVGTPDLFIMLGHPAPAAALERVSAFNADAKTAMIVHRDGRWGVIAAADQLRATAAGTLTQLRDGGVRRLALLSGDSHQTVEAIAKRTGVDEHYGQLLPEDKVRIIGELEEKYGPVAMIGDGVNDAPALSRASVGIAMGGIGSDAAMESADVVLMADDLRSLPYALDLAKRARSVVKQNLIIATGVMLTLVAWVFAGQHTPFGALKLPVAVSGHEGSTVVVILNGLRLLGGRRK